MRKILVRQTIDNAFKKRWQDLWNASYDAHIFNTPEWFLVARDVYSIKDYIIVSIEQDGELVLVIPLEKNNMFGVSIFCSFGGKFANKSSLLMKEENKKFLKELCDFLMKRGDFYLKEVSKTVADALCSNHKHLIKKEASVNPYLYISPDPFFYLSKKNKSQIRGIIRKNQEALRFQSFIGDKNALEIVFNVDENSSKKQQGKATFVMEKEKQFFRELIRKIPSSFIIDIVYYNNIPVVYGIGFACKNIYHASNTAFDASFRFLRPGKLLAYFRLNRLLKEKFDLIDFGRGDNMLKREFTNKAQIQYDVLYIPSLVSKYWITTIFKIRDGIIDNKYLYTPYLFFKKHFLYKFAQQRFRGFGR